MESPRSDHPSQPVSCSDRQPSQTGSCSDRQPSQTVSCSDRQPLQEAQGVSCSAPLTSQCTNIDYLARCQQQARYTYTLSPGVSSAGLSEMQVSRGNLYMHPDDRYTTRQRDLIDMDEDVGSEDDWKYHKDDDGVSQSDNSFRSVERPSALGSDPSPPPCRPLPPTPAPPAEPIGEPTRNHAGAVVPPQALQAVYNLVKNEPVVFLHAE